MRFSARERLATGLANLVGQSQDSWTPRFPGSFAESYYENAELKEESGQWG